MNLSKENIPGYPAKQGLYNPAYEHDACGVGLIVQKSGEKSHQIVENGLSILKNLEHRGAAGADPKAGDGAGMLTQIPHDFFQTATRDESFELPQPDEYGVGMVFLPQEEEERNQCMELFNKAIKEEKQELLGWRQVPTNNACLSVNTLDREPSVYQVFVKRKSFAVDSFERKLYVIRRIVEKAVAASEIAGKGFFYVCSLSARTIVYKGMFLANQIEPYYLDLQDPRFTSAIALVHQRYSTNTFPSWGLAQPFRYCAHNGEINTLQGNVNWTRAREPQFESDFFGPSIEKVKPVITPNGSDSATFDNVFELLVASGRTMEHSMMMMVPEAWENKKLLSKNLRGFYEFHAALMEPWDGPAALMYTDGIRVGGCLDRNGLRPVRFTETHDGFLIMASEAGVLDVATDNVKRKGRLGPGKMIIVDTEEGVILDNDDIKERVAAQSPYAQWVNENKIRLSDLPTPAGLNQPDHKEIRIRHRAFGYTYEQLHSIIKPMAQNGVEPTYSMGNDTPLAVLSDRTKTLYNYFKQRFAQVTNPPIDSIREEMVMSLYSNVGGGYNMLDETPRLCRMLEIDNPILDNSELEQLRNIKGGSFRSWTLDICYDYKKKNLEQALDELCETVEEAIDQGYRLIILSDRNFSSEKAAIPALLATAAVHHYLIRANKRGRIGIIVESAEVRETHHVALLFGYGAGAVNPYLSLESVTELCIHGFIKGVDSQQACTNYIKSIEKGLKKIFSKMGISTLASYRGAQIFEAIGLNSDVVNKYFTNTFSQIEGVSIEQLEEELLKRHHRAYIPEAKNHNKLITGGEYHWRQQGEFHAYNPETISLLHQAVREESKERYSEYAELVNNQSKNLHTLRGLMEFDYDNCEPIPLEEVEPASAILKRFVTGAMSIGSISREAHENIAIAMNKMGGRSNSGEGGEDPERFTPDADGTLRRSAIKQIASGRFGVTSHYLVNADELQIKMAQGAKPGEGGQLPGGKVSEYIGKLRHTIPGVTLISPPPHHDIYSIEDLAQLIFDLKNANTKANISVKLVAETGVGTVAAGVSKAHAELVTISGHDGGTGASPASSIKHTGGPWEIGLAETQQTLVLNNLRGQIGVQVDGQLKTGRDVVIGGLLGADQFGFATSVLVASGCLMMRKCHLNTCPVGIATQDPELRKKFKGKPEHVINFLTFIAEEAREIMAKLGIRKFDDLVGQVDLLKVEKAVDHWKAKGLDYSKLLVKQTSREGAYRHITGQEHYIDRVLDRELITRSKMALEYGKQVHFTSPIKNLNRTTGTMLGSEISRRYGSEGLPEDTIKIDFRGVAGQSFGAFIPKGLTMTLEGEGNDYVGKGLSGGKIIIHKPQSAKWKSHQSMIVGNTLLYGATSGEAYFSGLAGERFAVRNSGAKAVVEGVGDHGCEYMTGGVVVVLGETGRNFAAGMSGGVAFVYDKKKNFKRRCNTSMVDLEQLVDEDRIQELYTLIQKHYKLTGSEIANNILNSWEKSLKDFVLVMPLEYRRILALGDAG